MVWELRGSKTNQSTVAQRGEIAAIMEKAPWHYAEIERDGRTTVGVPTVTDRNGKTAEVYYEHRLYIGKGDNADVVYCRFWRTWTTDDVRRVQGKFGIAMVGWADDAEKRAEAAAPAVNLDAPVETVAAVIGAAAPVSTPQVVVPPKGSRRRRKAPEVQEVPGAGTATPEGTESRLDKLEAALLALAKHVTGRRDK